MRWFRRWLYFFRRTGEQILENSFLNAVTIGIIAATLFLFSSFLLILTDLNTLFDLWGKGIRIVAYMESDISAKEREGLMREIKTRSSVEEVFFVSKRQALERFQKMMRGNSEIVADLAEQNPLPASIEIQMKREYRQSAAMESFALWLKQREGVQDVVYGQTWVNRFATTLNLIRVVGFIFGGVLVLAAIFIISNTIKVNLFARKEELKIMQLVGATNWFIKVPFILEGALQGIFGTIIGLAALFGFYRLVMNRLSEVFPMPDFPFLSTSLFVWLLIGGAILGAAGSFVSATRFLRT